MLDSQKQFDVYVPDKNRYSGSIPVNQNRCRKRMFQRWYSSQCARKAVVEEEGYGWCKQHAPSAVKAKDDARKAKWKAQSDRADYQMKTQRLERALLQAAMDYHHRLSTEAHIRPLLDACAALDIHLAEQRP